MKRVLQRLWTGYLTLANLWQAIIALVLAAALGLGVFYGVSVIAPWISGPDYCAHRGATVVEKVGTECIGVSDGSYDFEPALADVDKKIRTENQAVTSEHPDDYATIVYLLPISSSDGSVLNIQNTVEQLRGAYVAQRRANTADIDGKSPYIQLLIASDGRQAEHWAKAVELIGKVAGPHRVTAVAGLGVSLSTTLQSIQALRAVGLPVVGSTVTADDYDNIPGFIRVSPSNRQAGAVAVEYAAQEFTRVDLVEDENTTDSYDASLVTAFKGFSAPGRTIVGQEAYDTTARTEAKNPGELALAQSVIKNRIGQMPTNVCAVQLPDQPAAVLFAGRGSDMAEFISDLKNRPCLDKHITVVSGSDGAEIPFTPEVKAGLDSGVTVYYSGLASPDEWQRDDDAAVSKGRQGFDEFKKAVDASFPGAPISDGNSMMAYDSVLTTVSAIRLATTPASAAHAANHLPPAQAVAGEFSALHGPLAVLGASGPLAFLADYTNDSLASDPNRKAVPIMLLNGDGTSKFQKLEWPPWPLALPLPY